MTNDANSILMGGGAPALKFDQIGTIYTGTVVAEPEARQQTDFKTKALETWPDGSPKMQVIVQLSTTLRDPQRPEDDGTRTLFIKGKELSNAVRNAVRQAGANGIHTGGVLTVQFVAEGPKPDPNLSAPKLYAASYQPPAVSFTGVAAPPAHQMTTPPPAPVQQQYAAPPQQPVYQQAPAVAPTGLPTAAGGPPPPGVDPGMWARMSPDQQAAIAAVHAAQTTGY